MSVRIRTAAYETVQPVIDEAVRLAAEPGGPLADLAGKTVFVKPNTLGEFAPERGVTTHPAVVHAVTKALLDMGATVIVGDNPGMRGYGANERSAERSGIRDAATVDGVACWRNIAVDPVPVETPCEHLDRFMVSRAALEADVFVSVPKFKTHVSTVLTGAIKNSYGLLVGGQKALLHRRATGSTAFAAAVVDVFAVRPPDFVVVDGIVAMEGNGPSGTDLRDLGLILSGTNAVEVDAVMATLMGVAPASVPLLRTAHRRGLGEIDVDRIDVDGPLDPAPGYKVPFAKSGDRLGVIGARLLTYLVVGRPVLRKRACVQCGVCARQCPVDAITMDPYPRIDHRRCVLCYCCNEFCDHDAMDVQRHVRWWRRRHRPS